MKAKRIIGFILLFAAIFAFGSKFVNNYTGHLDGVLLVLIVLIVGLLLFLGIGRVLRS